MRKDAKQRKKRKTIRQLIGKPRKSSDGGSHCAVRGWRAHIMETCITKWAVLVLAYARARLVATQKIIVSFFFVRKNSAQFRFNFFSFWQNFLTAIWWSCECTSGQPLLRIQIYNIERYWRLRRTSELPIASFLTFSSIVFLRESYLIRDWSPSSLCLWCLCNCE